LDKIIILAQGPSWYQCPYDKEESPEGTEIWGSNVIFRDHRVDRIFFAHDPRQELLHDDMNLFENLNKLKVPVYTTGIFKVLKKGAQIPIAELMEKFKVGFFLNVICWMTATAVLQNPKVIEFYGVDMRPDAGNESFVNEKGGVEFWVGAAIGRGISFKNTKESFILKTKQEGFFPNPKKKVLQKGLYSLVPERERNPEDIRSYVIMPDGDEI
jgi:hypothetical protein